MIGSVVPGRLYLFRTSYLSGRDRKSHRPGVVLAPPAKGLTDVPLLMRTSALDEDGVAHRAKPGLTLSLDGVFAFRHLRYIDELHFGVPGVARYLGMLEAVPLKEVLRWWEAP